MKLTINTNTANTGLAYVMAACESKSTLPILKNVLIHPDGNDYVSITATNSQQQLSVKLPCEWGEQASITIEGRKLADIFKKLPKDSDATITLTPSKTYKDQHCAQLKCGRSKFTLNTLPASEYPDFNTESATGTHTVNGSELKHALDRCFVAMASNDVRYYLNGMHLNFKPGEVDVVATDGHRMNMATITSEGEPIAVTIPYASVKPVMAVLGSDNINLSIGETFLTASDGARTVTVKLVDGKYPDYDRVKPKNNQIHVEFSRNELIGAVSRALLLSNEKFRGIKLDMTNGQCEVTGNNSDQEQAEEILACNYQGDGLTIGFNGQYLLDALNSIDMDSVVLQFASEAAPALLQDGNFSAVVMPYRI